MLSLGDGKLDGAGCVWYGWYSVSLLINGVGLTRSSSEAHPFLAMSLTLDH